MCYLKVEKKEKRKLEVSQLVNLMNKVKGMTFLVELLKMVHRTWRAVFIGSDIGDPTLDAIRIGLRA